MKLFSGENLTNDKSALFQEIIIGADNTCQDLYRKMASLGRNKLISEQDFCQSGVHAILSHKNFCGPHLKRPKTPSYTYMT